MGGLVDMHDGMFLWEARGPGAKHCDTNTQSYVTGTMIVMNTGIIFSNV